MTVEFLRALKASGKRPVDFHFFLEDHLVLTFVPVIQYKDEELFDAMGEVTGAITRFIGDFKLDSHGFWMRMYVDWKTREQIEELQAEEIGERK